MPSADSNRVNLAFVAESEFGVVPSGPAPTLQDLRLTGESLKQDTAITPSLEIRADRQKADIIRTNASASGDINIEFSYGTYDSLMMAALLSAGWSSAATDTDIVYAMDDADNSINRSSGSFVTDGFLVNQWVKISGFTTAANNGLAKIVSVVAAKMVLSHITVVDEVEGDTVTVTMGGQIVNGVTPLSHVIERTYSDLSNEFAYYTGMMVNTFNLSVASDQIVTGSLGFLGKRGFSGTATVGDGSNTAATTTLIFEAIDHVPLLMENVAGASATEFTFQLNNNLRQRLKIGELGPFDIGTGSIDLSGTFRAYYEDSAVFDRYLAFTSTSIAIAFEDFAGNSYVFDMPNVKLGPGQRVAGGINQDIIADLGWSAFRHGTEGITVRIARFPAA